MIPDTMKRTKGVVTRSTGKWYRVDTGDRMIDCRLPGRFRLQEEATTNPVAVGDRVEVTPGEDGYGTIESIAERKNYIPRQATHGRRGEQILVANVDRAWCVVSIRKPKPKRGFIDRFLVTCEAYDVPAGVILNKYDLATGKDRREFAELSELYRKLGYPVLTTSIHDPESLALLSEALSEGVSVFIGPSGTGKSSLLNAIDPTLGLKISEVSDSSGKGRHTTTFARLIRFGDRGRVADTPGIRELGLVNIEPYELSLFFPEMETVREDCKFYNCTHSHEPGCSVMEAFERGEIHPERYHSYMQILDSITGDERSI